MLSEKDKNKLSHAMDNFVKKEGYENENDNSLFLYFDINKKKKELRDD